MEMHFDALGVIGLVIPGSLIKLPGADLLSQNSGGV